MGFPKSFSNPSSCGSTGGDERSNKKKGVAAVKLSTDPQSVAARQRRHRISDRFKILKSMVPGGSKMDTVSMLEETIQYVKFLKTQIWLHQAVINLVENVTYDVPSVEPNINCAVLPFYNYQNVDWCDCHVGGHVEEVGWSECWLSEEENGGFDACPWENN